MMGDILDGVHLIIAVPLYFIARLALGQYKAFVFVVKEAWRDA